MSSKPQLYRDFIDHLVEVCQRGQGQIGANRVRAGFGITDEFNALLKRLSGADRQVLARMMLDEVELGVFETLKALEQFSVTPFETGYEGSAFNDFIGRLNGWRWPEP
jgi:hypothetical protein